MSNKARIAIIVLTLLAAFTLVVSGVVGIYASTNRIQIFVGVFFVVMGLFINLVTLKIL